MSVASEGETGALHLSHFPLPIPSLLPPHSCSHLSPSLLPNTMRISPHAHADKAALSQELANFFVLKVDNIRSTIDSSASSSSVTPSDNSNSESQHTFHQFKELSEEEIVSLVSSAPNKSYILDPIPASLVKSSLPILAPILTKIVNVSLSTGHFPSPWKRAIILPKLKRPNLDPIFSNYRPLSNLSFISKITERAASIQVVNHLTLHHLFPGTQSAYRKHHSTETALLKVTNDILLSMNRQHVSLLVLLDLSSAFDTVDHTILLNRLQSHFGICGSSLSWFESYLLVGLNSSRLRVLIPQISRSNTEFLRVLVLVRFSLASILVLYSTSLGPTSPTCTAMPTILRSIFLLNPVPSLRKNLLSPPSNLASPRSVPGSSPTSCLSMTPRLSRLSSKVASSCFYYIYNIRRIRKYLSREVCETLVNSLITSRLDYCNSLLYGCPSSLLARLQRVQNSAARLVYNVSCTFSSSPLLINLHWLPVKHRILLKILLITYKAIHSLAPDYIIQLIQVKSSNRTLRSSNAILLEHPYYQIFQNSG